MKINKEAQLDVLVWLEFLSNFNGKAFSCTKTKLVVMHFSYIQMQQGQEGMVNVLGANGF